MVPWDWPDQCASRIDGGGEKQVSVRGVDGLRHGLEFHARPQHGLGGIGEIHSAHPCQRLEDCGPLGIEADTGRLVHPWLATTKTLPTKRLSTGYPGSITFTPACGPRSVD